jgi:beta-glucosidase
LKKRTKKLLLVWCRARWTHQALRGEGAEAKVFCFFFSKNKAFLPVVFLVLAADRADLLVGQLTQPEKLRLLHGYFALPPKPPGAIGSAGYVPGVPRLGIPALQETDASLGVTNPADVRPGDTAVALPSTVAIAASFNPLVAYQTGAVLGREAAARGFNVVLGGGVDLAREPRGGRNFEYAGEDPLLAGVMVGAAVRGTQDQQVISTIKHFAVNDQESQRDTLNVVMPWAALRESDLLAFEIALEQGHPGAVMCAYNKVNGPWACENATLLNAILKQDFHYPGFVLSDWGAVHSVGAITAGLDQESAQSFDAQAYFDTPLRDAVARGDVAQARIDDAVRRILRSMDAAGLFDARARPVPDVAADVRTARDAAAEGIVLLRNVNGALPLSHGIRKLVVIGADSDAGVAAGGGSSQVTPVGGYARQVPLGTNGMEGYFRMAVFDPPSPLSAIQARVPGAKIVWVDGRYPRQAALLARDADAAIVFADQWTGESTDAPDLSLPAGQDGLIDAVAAANPHVIVVLETSGPVLMPWRDKTAGIVEAWYAGSGGADAIADVLFGAVNPSGRLPVTFPASEADLPNATVAGMYLPPESAVPVTYREGADAGYRWYARTGKTPLYGFGFGLSYTQFALSHLQVQGGLSLTISFDVQNVGARAGMDTPQAYVLSRAGRAGVRLIGWSKRALAPGETQHVTLSADPRLLADFVVDQPGWLVPAGDYVVGVGESVGDIALSGTARVEMLRLPP